jgi:hypothetical protein
MEQFFDNLKREAEANPVMAMAAAAALITAISKLVEAHGHHKGSVAFAKDVERRVRQSKRK